MKILIVHDKETPLSTKSALGGIEAVSMGVYRALSKHTDHEVWIMDSADSNLYPKEIKIIKHGFRSSYQHLQMLKNKEKPGRWQDPFSIKNVQEIYILIGKINPDLIIFNSKFLSDLERVLKLGINTIHFVHDGEDFPTNVFYRDLRQMKKKYKNLRVIAPSQTVMDGVNFFRPKTIDDFCFWSFYEPELHQVPKVGKGMIKRLIYVGRIMDDKNLNLLIDTYGSRSEYEILLMGVKDFFGHRELMSSIKAAEKLHNNLTVMCKHEGFESDLIHIKIARSAVFILTSIDESFCLAAFEAQKLGVPVIYAKMRRSSAVGEYVVDGFSGIGVQLEDRNRGQISEELMAAVRNTEKMDREAIYQHFKENYSQKKFAKSLDQKITKVFE